MYTCNTIKYFFNAFKVIIVILWLLIATKAKIESVFGEAVSKFNDAGCVKWVPRNTETHYITVLGNEQMWVHLKGTNRDK